MGGPVLALYLLYAALGFGLRTFLHWRRTGSSGFNGISGRPGSLERKGGLLFAVALVLGLAAPLLDIAGVLSPIGMVDGSVAHGLGFVLFALGLGGTMLAQFAMGDSWRIGVDTSERTALVTGGPFAYVRNPIFTAMLLASAGLMLLVPNIVAVLAFVAFLSAIEIQVRAVEEPYLLGTQGSTYACYAQRVGRFVPGIGMLGSAGRTTQC